MYRTLGQILESLLRARLPSTLNFGTQFAAVITRPLAQAATMMMVFKLARASRCHLLDRAALTEVMAPSAAIADRIVRCPCSGILQTAPIFCEQHHTLSGRLKLTIHSSVPRLISHPGTVKIGSSLTANLPIARAFTISLTVSAATAAAVVILICLRRACIMGCKELFSHNTLRLLVRLLDYFSTHAEYQRVLIQQFRLIVAYRVVVCQLPLRCLLLDRSLRVPAATLRDGEPTITC
jgi:hypothetical protein